MPAAGACGAARVVDGVAVAAAAGVQLRAVECDPAIITRPGASTAPLPPPGSDLYSDAPQYDGASSPLPTYPDPAIDAGQDQTGWADPDAPEPEPAWPPDDQSELQWWKPN